MESFPGFELLIVDDSPLVHKILNKMISDNFEISLFEAENAWAAIRILGNHNINLILMDINMPGMDGFETARIIRSNRKYQDIPIIFITGSDTEANRAIGQEIGGIDFLTKPFTEPEFVRFLTLYIKFIQRERQITSKLIALNKKLIKKNIDTSDIIKPEESSTDAKTEESKMPEPLPATEPEPPKVEVKKPVDEPHTVTTLQQFSGMLKDLNHRHYELLHLVSGLFNNFNKLSDKRIMDYLSSINRQANDSGNMLAKVAKYAEVKSATVKIESKWVDVFEVINLASSKYEKQFLDKRIRINNEITQETLVYADYESLILIFSELISNAIKFSYKDSDLRYFTKDLGDRIKISIKDFGAGIELENIPVLLNQGDLSSEGTLGETGFGLGLKLVDELVALNNGTWEIDSIYNKGTVLSIVMPKL